MEMTNVYLRHTAGVNDSKYLAVIGQDSLVSMYCTKVWRY